MKDVIGLGALNVDFIYEVARLELGKGSIKFRSGAEIFTDLKEFDSVKRLLQNVGKLRGKSGGGQAANTAVALSRMGFSTGFVGKVGRDSEGDFLIRSMMGVDTSRILKNERSGICLSVLDEFKDRSTLILPNCNDTLTFDEIDLDYIKDAQFLHMTSFIGDLPLMAQRRVAEEVFSEVKITFDPGEIYANRNLREILPIIKRSFAIFITDREIELLTGKDFSTGAKELLNMGCSIVACKLGERGSHILSQTQEFSIPAERVEVMDKTGAGDVYAAGFLAGLLLERPLYECAKLATKAAALSITGYGRGKYPDKLFLTQVLRNLSQWRRGGDGL